MLEIIGITLLTVWVSCAIIHTVFFGMFIHDMYFTEFGEAHEGEPHKGFDGMFAMFCLYIITTIISPYMLFNKLFK